MIAISLSIKIPFELQYTYHIPVQLCVYSKRNGICSNKGMIYKNATFWVFLPLLGITRENVRQHHC